MPSVFVIATIIGPVCAMHSVRPVRCIISHFTLGYYFIDEAHWAQLLAQHYITSHFAANPWLSNSQATMLVSGEEEYVLMFPCLLLFGGGGCCICGLCPKQWELNWVQKGIGCQNALETHQRVSLRLCYDRRWEPCIFFSENLCRANGSNSWVSSSKMYCGR